MTAVEVSEVFGVNRVTVNRAISMKRLHARKSGRIWLIARRDAEREWPDGPHKGVHIPQDGE